MKLRDLKPGVVARIIRCNQTPSITGYNGTKVIIRNNRLEQLESNGVDDGQWWNNLETLIVEDVFEVEVVDDITSPMPTFGIHADNPTDSIEQQKALRAEWDDTEQPTRYYET